ncbi:MAG: cyclodeaminase/cyclohydrolase family protein [Lachnospiraceae bacterium]|nr:cyclodeaminase/cyclohydrolase family protein [Lachnospiraceae bacterium]
MADLKNLSVEEFAAVTASDAPAPGGGSVSALAGALGAALAEMVANLTVGKAKYAEVEDEMKELSAKGAEIRSELIAGIQKDTESFTMYMNALGMPKDTDEQKAVRREAMQNGLKEAAKVPLEVAETAAKIFPIAEAVVKRGNTNAVTDGLVASMMARTAVIGALFNVKINLGSIKDEAFVADMAAKVKALEELAITSEQAILKACELSNELY